MVPKNVSKTDDTVRYRISHITSYQYSDPVPVSHNELHLTPRDSRRQQVRSHRLEVKPKPVTLSRRLDYFGNHVHYFSQSEGHRRLRIASYSRVTVRATPLPALDSSDAWELVARSVRAELVPSRLEALQYVFNSPSITSSAALREFAAPSFPAGKPILEGMKDLCHRIFSEFAYDGTATSVHSSAEEVLALRRGVCQDYAQLMIGGLRSLGLPARYVSGYLRTYPPPGRPRLIGADATHAWVSVFCNDLGWVDIDPTNDVFPYLEHVTIAWGRDYGDVCPVKGVFLGGGAHQMTVSVDVAPLDEESRDGSKERSPEPADDSEPEDDK